MNLVGLNDHFASMLLGAELRCIVPFVITSGLRSVAENKRVGGVKGSSHLLGIAVDINCVGSVDRFLVVNALLSVGFRRIGVYEDHVHVDISRVSPQGVMWLK